MTLDKTVSGTALFRKRIAHDIQYLKPIVLFSVFLLPVTCNLVEHSASTILAVLTAIGIYEWIAGRNRFVFNRSEKIIIATVAFYFFGALVFFIAGGLFREGAGFNGTWTMKSGSSPLFQFTFSSAARAWPAGSYGTAQQWPPSFAPFLRCIMYFGFTHPRTLLPSLWWKRCGSPGHTPPFRSASSTWRSAA